MNTNQKILLGIFGIAAITVVIAWYVISIKWVSLMPGVPAGEVNRSVREKLLAWNVDYRLNDKTGEILVAEKQLVDVRMRLSQQGISLAEDQGFEVFAKSEYGMSEFVQNLNYQRALEVELSRTVGAIQGIKSAKVHLSFEKESIFKEKKKEAKASVIIELSNNVLLKKDMVKGIQQLVATSVPGLAYENVVVVDKQGAQVNAASNKDDQLVSSRLELEQQYANKATDLAAAIMPGSEIKAAVNIEYNTEKKHTILERLIPSGGDGKGFIVKSKTLSEQAAVDPSVTAQKDKKTNQEIEYSYSTEKSEIVFPDAIIGKVTVAIVVRHDLSKTLSSDDIKLAVTNALGLNAERGDAISVTDVKLNSKSEVVAESDDLPDHLVDRVTPHTASLANLFSNHQFAALSVLALGVLAFLGGLLVSSRNNRSEISDIELQKLSNEIKLWMNS